MNSESKSNYNYHHAENSIKSLNLFTSLLHHMFQPDCYIPQAYQDDRDHIYLPKLTLILQTNIQLHLWHCTTQKALPFGSKQYHRRQIPSPHWPQILQWHTFTNLVPHRALERQSMQHEYVLQCLLSHNVDKELHARLALMAYIYNHHVNIIYISE